MTIPATVGISWIMYQLTQLPGAAAWATVGPVLLVLGGGIAYAMTHTITAEDVDAEIPPELELAEPLPGEAHGAPASRRRGP